MYGFRTSEGFVRITEKAVFVLGFVGEHGFGTISLPHVLLCSAFPPPPLACSISLKDMGIRPGHRFARTFAPRASPPWYRRPLPIAHSHIDPSPSGHSRTCRRSIFSWLPKEHENGWFKKDVMDDTVRLVQRRLRQDPYGRIRLIRASTASIIAKFVIKRLLFGFRLGVGSRGPCRPGRVPSLTLDSGSARRKSKPIAYRSGRSRT